MPCNIMIVKIGKRREKSPKVQEVLAQFGCSIKTRLGLHETDNACSDEGVLILQLTGEEDEMYKLEEALNELSDVKAQMVILD
ncbi:MAG: hypothetical protein ACYCX2_02565 [Christensenellales bacterium]